jgi:hypothetical protein
MLCVSQLQQNLVPDVDAFGHPLGGHWIGYLFNHSKSLSGAVEILHLRAKYRSARI